MRVLVTRATGPAKSTGQHLIAAGHQPVLLPLTVFRDTGRPIPSRQYDAVVFTSPAACEILAGRKTVVLSQLLKLPAICVGEATAEAARSIGFESVESGAGSAAQLAELIEQRFAGRSAHILYPAARDRAFDLKATLARTGIAVDEVEIYAAELIDPGAGAVAEALTACAGGAALLYSVRTAEHLFLMADRHGMKDRMSGLTFLAISENVGSAVPRGLEVRVAVRPSEDALLDLLDGPSKRDKAFPGNDHGKGE